MKQLKVKRFTSRMLGANTYILYNNNIGIIIDPCTKVGIIQEFCEDNNLKIVKIVLTHCHIDHTLYLNEYIDAFDVEFAIHKDDNSYNMDQNLNGARLFGMKKAFKSADLLLIDNDLVKIGDSEVKIIATPGHSPGSICIFGDNLLISGDTLFNLSIGRSDLPGGNQAELIQSLEKIMQLPDDTIVYPGHGTFTTIKFERENNPFLT